jgi:hypothetical protein
MKRRFTRTDSGELADRDGRVLSAGSLLRLAPAIESITFAANSDELRGTIGGGVDLEVGVDLDVPGGSDVSKTTPIPPKIAAVWQHYVDIFGTRFRFNPQRRRIIENALKVRDVETCKAAITGLSRSPHHMGDNDQGIRYTDIRYALRGNAQRGESVEERIDRMASLASSPAAVQVGSVLEGQIDALKNDVRRAARRDPNLPSPTHHALELRDEAVRRLEGYGINVRYDDNGWPIFEAKPSIFEAQA